MWWQQWPGLMTKLAFSGNSAQCTPRALSHMLCALDFTTLQCTVGRWSHCSVGYTKMPCISPRCITIPCISQSSTKVQGRATKYHYYYCYYYYYYYYYYYLLLLVHKACCLSCTREAVFNGADHHCHIALAVKQRNSQQSFFNRFQWGLPSSLCDHGNCQIDSFGINLCFPWY